LTVVALWTLSSRAEAGLYFPPDTSPLIIPAGFGATVSYDASLQRFGAITSGPFALDVTGGLHFGANDIVSTFTMAANIDNSGNVLNGSFSLIGQSATLGISAPTKLVSGNIVGVGGFQGMVALGEFASVLQFYVDDVLVDSSIGDLTGSFGAAVIDFYAFVPGFNSAGLPDFSKSYSGTTATDAPGIYLVSSVPEPASLLVYGASFALLTLFRRRNQRLGSITTEHPDEI
jgi:hypothetical protein